jgi:hypothetical protein
MVPFPMQLTFGVAIAPFQLLRAFPDRLGGPLQRVFLGIRRFEIQLIEVGLERINRAIAVWRAQAAGLASSNSPVSASKIRMQSGAFMNIARNRSSLSRRARSAARRSVTS